MIILCSERGNNSSVIFPQTLLSGQKMKVEQKLPGVAGGESCHLACSSLLSQLCHLGQRSGIFHILGTVHSLLLWLLGLRRGNWAAEKQCSCLRGWDAEERVWLPVSVNLDLTGKRALSCQAGSVLPVQPSAS